MTIPIGSTIRQIREGQGLHLREVAERIPTSFSYLWEVERENKTPSMPMLESIAKALDLETAELWFAIYKNMGAK